MARSRRNLSGVLLLGMFAGIVAMEYSKTDGQVACHLVRNAVDPFTADKKTAPRSLEELLRQRNLLELPKGVGALEDCVPTRGDAPVPKRADPPAAD